MKHTSYWATLALLATALGPAHILAGENMGESVTTMDEVVVTAGRIDEPVREVSSKVTVIDREELKVSAARDLGDLLAEKGLGFIKKYPGGQTAVGIRGFKTDSLGNDLRGHVLILLNGRRAGTGNAAKLLIGNIERIEIIRGPGAVQYGSAAMGGVINVITRQGAGDPGLTVYGGLGSYGYGERGLATAGKVAGFDFAASYSHETMDDYDTGSGETFHNTGYSEKEGYSLNLGYEFLPGHRLGAIFSRFNGEHLGNPDYISANDLDNYKDSSNQSVDLIYTGKSLELATSWMVRYYDGKDENNWYDPFESNVSGWDDGIPSTNTTEQQGGQAQLSLDRDLFLVTGGLDWQKYEVESSWDPTETEYANYAGFLLAKLRLMEGKVILDGGLRYDYYEVEVVEPAGREEDDTNLTPSVGLAYLPLDGLKLRAHYAEAFVMPGADQLAADYTNWGVRNLGNPDLKPETSRTYEAGLDYEKNGFTGSLGYFFTRFRDKIERVAAGSVMTWENVGIAEISGFEGEFSYDLGVPLDWPYEVKPYASFTHIDRYRDLENDTDLTYINEWHATWGLLVSDLEGFSTRLNFAYSGRHRAEDWESGAFNPPIIEMGGFTVADLTVVKRLADLEDYGAFTLKGEITNLFDTDYDHVKGYPMPGRAFFLTLMYTY